MLHIVHDEFGYCVLDLTRNPDEFAYINRRTG